MTAQRIYNDAFLERTDDPDNCGPDAKYFRRGVNLVPDNSSKPQMHPSIAYAAAISIVVYILIYILMQVLQ